MVALRAMVACLFMLTLGLPLTAESQQPERVLFIPLDLPCRALDTRLTGGPIPADVPFPIQISGVCDVPATAVGAALNLTITGPQGAGYLTAWPSGPTAPFTAAVNFTAGEDVGNAVDIGLGPTGGVLVQSIVPTDLVVDIYGYFTGGELTGSNTALGDSALSSTTLTGTSNTALGAGALTDNTTGTGNTALGDRALTSNTTGNTNTALGGGALLINTAGSDNTALGVIALASNTTGVNNTALGHSALSKNTTGNSNIAIGIGAGQNLTDGSSNIHIGNVGVDLRPQPSASAPRASKRAPSSPGTPARPWPGGLRFWWTALGGSGTCPHRGASKTTSAAWTRPARGWANFAPSSSATRRSSPMARARWSTA